MELRSALHEGKGESGKDQVSRAVISSTNSLELAELFGDRGELGTFIVSPEREVWGTWMCPVPFFLHGYTVVLGPLLNAVTGLSRFKIAMSVCICLSPQI